MKFSGFIVFALFLLALSPVVMAENVTNSTNSTPTPTVIANFTPTPEPTVNATPVANATATPSPTPVPSITPTPLPSITPTPLCVDSDGGKNANVYGVVNASGKAYKDVCLSSRSVREYYCNGNVAAKTEIKCALGFSCKNGACTNSSANATVKVSSSKTGAAIASDSNSAKKACRDSDGKNFFRKGKVQANNTAYQDFCPNATTVAEYSCSGKRLMWTNHTCQFGCFDGACQKKNSTNSTIRPVSSGKKVKANSTTPTPIPTFASNSTSPTPTLEANETESEDEFEGNETASPTARASESSNRRR